MSASNGPEASRQLTDDSLRIERTRADDELLVRAHALAEDSEELIGQARERARRVLELARRRADDHLLEIGATEALSRTVQVERRAEDAALAGEHAVEDARRSDEREQRRRAVEQLLSGERAATDHMLDVERAVEDRRLGAREDLLSTVAHDLRTMLSTVVVNASVVLLAPDLATARPAAAGIQRAGAQMAQLLDNLLDVAGFDAARLSLVRAEVDLVRIARDAAVMFDEVARSRGVALGVHAEDGSAVASVDARRITRLLVNLIGNALKYTPAGGRVEVAVAALGDECELAVRDTGIGIPEDQLQAIFDRFHRVATANRGTAGVGLGLYVCRRIAEAHGGRIWAESAAGAGTTIRARLPVR